MDQLLPPFIRDSFILRYALYIVFKADSAMVWKFRENFPMMTDREVQAIYARLSKHALKVSTDINLRCLAKLNTEMAGKIVLDAGCGTGKLAETNSYTEYIGVDFVEHKLWNSMKTDSTSFREMSVETLDFAENTFDLVICAHVLEHVRRPLEVLIELRRVTKSQAVVILPRERSYKAGFNLHVNHYQYEWEIQHLFNQVPGVSSSIELIDGDFYCNLVFAK